MKTALSFAALSWPYVSYATVTLDNRPPDSRANASSNATVCKCRSGRACRTASLSKSSSVIHSVDRRRARSALRRLQRLIQILDNVAHVFDADRQANILRRHAGLGLLLRRQL